MKHKFYNTLLFTTLILLIPVYMISAGVANPKPFNVTQPDGSQLTIRLFGDEWHHYAQTLDGYTIIKKQNTWVYAIQNEAGKLIPSNQVAHQDGLRTDTEIFFLNRIGKTVQPSREVLQKTLERNPFRNIDKIKSQRFFKSSKKKTTRKVLVLLADYPDLPGSESIQSFEEMMNQDGWEGGIGATGSFNDYFEEVSYGQFGIDADVYGWYTGSQNYRYYSDENGMIKAQELVADAIDAAEADGVDFSLYDNDGDGEVEQVIVVHAGLGAEQWGDTQYIWAHYWCLSASYRVRNYDGVRINYYTIQPELQYDRHTGIGMYCHEFGHALGLPDLYDTDDTSEGIGYWGVMATGAWCNSGRTPPHYNAWCKKELGWIVPQIVTNSGIYQIKKTETDNSQTYMIDIQNDDSEYFLLENRQKVGFDTYLPGDGLLIWHIDTDILDNNDENHKRIDLEEADGLNHLDRGSNNGDAGDPFPGSYNNRTFDAYSDPNSNSYSDAFSIVSITDISDSDSVMSAFINVDALASFGSDPKTGHAPLTVQFTDESISQHPVQSWAWDFENDGLVDSDLQNPQWTYTTSGRYSVGLEITTNQVTTRVELDDLVRIFDGTSSLSFEEEGVWGIVPANVNLNTTNAMTLEAWIYPTGWRDENAQHKIIDKFHYSLAIHGNTDGAIAQESLVFTLTDENDNTCIWHTKSYSILTNNWRHVAVTFDADTFDVHLLINGIDETVTQIGDITGSIKDHIDDNLYIGNTSTELETFEGRIDDLRVWSVVRSETEIQENMNRYLKGDEAGLVGYWKMDEGSGEPFNDSSPNDLTGTSYGTWEEGKPLDDASTGLHDDTRPIPTTCRLYQNHPNPFNPKTTIEFDLPVESKVSLKIFNVVGQEIQEMTRKVFNAGHHALSFNAVHLSSGIYIFTLNADGKDGSHWLKKQKMIVLK